MWAIAESMYEDPAAMTKAPFVVFGSGAEGSMKGQRSTNPTWLMKYLSRFFVVIILDEFNSSQKCPKCLSSMKDFLGYRVKRCSNSECHPSNRHDMHSL
jgi:hypothetical protein